MTKFKRNLKRSLVFFTVILVCAAVIVIHHSIPQKGRTARIIQNGEVIRTVDLGTSCEFTVMSPNGGYNTVQVKDGKIGITEADCPDRICVRRGFIDRGGLPIVCLPHKLSVVITDDSVADAVTGG